MPIGWWITLWWPKEARVMPPPPGEAKVMPPPGEARLMPPPGDARVMPPPPGSILRVGMAGMGDMADSCSTSLILGPLKLYS